MNFVGQILLSIGTISLLLGYLGICFCAFSISLGKGLLCLLFPIFGFGVAMRRFPWLIWLWGGGIALIVIGSMCV